MKNNNRKKILFLITKSNWGGAQRYVFDLATHLPKEQFDVIVALGGNGPLISVLKDVGIQVVEIPGLQRDVSLLKELTSTVRIAQIIRKEKPDILHVNSSKSGAIGALLGRILFVPRVIFTSHGWAFNEDRPLFQKLIIKLIHWLTVLFSHKTIAVSNGLKCDMNWPLVQNKMTVVNMGREVLDMKTCKEARNEIKNFVPRLQTDQNTFWIGTIAELHPIKRLNRAIDSVASLSTQFPDLRFIIIHDGESRAELENQVANLHLEKHVFFTGVIPEAAKLLPAFDLFVLPSKSESFGYVLVEAGLAGIPVVATSVGGVTDIITHEEGGILVEPDDTEALTGAIQTLMENTELREKFARAHYDKSKSFTVEKMTRETLLVYNV